jgi:hypothetical protein
VSERRVLAGLRRWADVAADGEDLLLTRAVVWELLGEIDERENSMPIVHLVGIVVVSLALWAGIIEAVTWLVW